MTDKTAQSMADELREAARDEALAEIGGAA